VASAEASVHQAEANLVQMKARLQQAERDWARAQKLGPSEALAQAAYDAYQSAYETARANVAVAEAAILQAKAAVAQAEAVQRRAQRNLGYCTIKSPVKGVIIARRVNIGQTVVSSLNAPSLFLIAKDLTRMQVWVAVNEADIGKIHPGLPVHFTVNAETFRGEVGKVRLDASMTQNVVTYTVEVITDNSSGRLLPYQTANVQFELERRPNVLRVPGTALQWAPRPDAVAPEFREAAAQAARNENGQEATIWAVREQKMRPVRVRVGLSDGALTEVEGEGLAEGLQVVVGEEQAAAAAGASAANPFVPQIPRRRPAGSSR
jgi:HlyD family secretion protein